jgi:hypothetical protein
VQEFRNLVPTIFSTKCILQIDYFYVLFTFLPFNSCSSKPHSFSTFTVADTLKALPSTASQALREFVTTHNVDGSFLRTFRDAAHIQNPPVDITRLVHLAHQLQSQFKQKPHPAVAVVVVEDEYSHNICFETQSNLDNYLRNAGYWALMGADGTAVLSLSALRPGASYSGLRGNSTLAQLKNLENRERALVTYTLDKKLSDYAGEQVEFFNHDQVLAGLKKGADLGDVDTLFVAQTKHIHFLVERKHSVSRNPDDVILMKQIEDTTKAYMDQLSEDERKVATVKRVLFCPALHDSVLTALRMKGILVLTEQLVFYTDKTAE